jgi:hypothetical protein
VRPLECLAVLCLEGSIQMRFKIIASTLAVALLTVGAYGGEDDNGKKGQKTRKMATKPATGA